MRKKNPGGLHCQHGQTTRFRRLLQKLSCACARPGKMAVRIPFLSSATKVGMRMRKTRHTFPVW